MVRGREGTRHLREVRSDGQAARQRRVRTTASTTVPIETSIRSTGTSNSTDVMGAARYPGGHSAPKG